MLGLTLAAAYLPAAQPQPRLVLELQDYAALPVTADNTNDNTQKAYDAVCAACHGNLPPDLTDAQWDHGSSDGEIYTVIKRGVPSTMMAGFDGKVPDDQIWSIVNYLRSLAPAR